MLEVHPVHLWLCGMGKRKNTKQQTTGEAGLRASTCQHARHCTACGTAQADADCHATCSMAVQAAVHIGGPLASWLAGLLHPLVLQLPAQARRPAC